VSVFFVCRQWRRVVDEEGGEVGEMIDPARVEAPTAETAACRWAAAALPAGVHTVYAGPGDWLDGRTRQFQIRVVERRNAMAAALQLKCADAAVVERGKVWEVAVCGA
jgi:hypothetical protein